MTPPLSPYSAKEKAYWKDPLPVSLPPSSSIPVDIVSTSRYGLSYPLQPLLQQQLTAFCSWSSNLVQLDRGGAYVNAAQSITVENHEAHVVAFLGFVSLFTSKALHLVSLSCYEEPHLLLSFICFLRVSLLW